MQRCSENITVNEREITRPIFNYLKKNKVINLIGGGSIQILNSGYLNKYAGLDIKDICFLKSGELIAGDAEIDIKSSYWKEHGHDLDPDFQNVKLHIITENNYKTNIDTILIDLSSLNKKHKKYNAPKVNAIELQDYAAKRLKRKAAQFSNLSLKDAWSESLKNFLSSYLKKRKRLSNKLVKLQSFFENRFNNDAFFFLKNNQNERSHYQDLHHLLSSDFITGDQLKKEIMINCILPVAISKFKYHYQLWLWYWEVNSETKYGKLKNEFPEYSQNYIWQQQGMLEYIFEQKN